jgi:hypothetical protein
LDEVSGCRCYRLISATTLSNASAQEPTCRVVRVEGTSWLEECGKQLNSYSLSLSETKLGLSDIKREGWWDMHGRFSFSCPVEPICGNEPIIGGTFIDSESWNNSSKDEGAIFQVLRPLMAMSLRGGAPSEVPTSACPLFDVSIDGMAGRAVCFDEAKMGGGNVVVVAASDHVGFLLIFSQSDQSANVVRKEALELLPRFKIERATGDVALLKWMR